MIFSELLSYFDPSLRELELTTPIEPDDLAGVFRDNLTHDSFFDGGFVSNKVLIKSNGSTIRLRTSGSKRNNFERYFYGSIVPRQGGGSVLKGSFRFPVINRVLLLIWFGALLAFPIYILLGMLWTHQSKGALPGLLWAGGISLTLVVFTLQSMAGGFMEDADSRQYIMDEIGKCLDASPEPPDV